MTMKTKNNRINFIGGYQPKDDTPVTPPPAVKPAHKLERCGQFLGIRPCEKYVPKTNADRIRCMTDEELVELLMKTLGDCSYDSKCPAKQICEGTISCRDIILKWLKAPAEGLEERI